MRIAIIGSGFLGTKLSKFFSKEHEVFEADRTPKKHSVTRLDATDKEAVREFLLTRKPEAVIDTVALTSSVACEKNPELCRKLNYETAKNIAEVCREINSKLIFISSSYVFDGQKGNYTEEDSPFPINEYAKMKVLAEKEILKLPNSIVIRTEPLYGYDENSNQLKFGTANFEKDLEIGKTDLIRSPVFIDDVPRIISALLEKNQAGIFNIAGPDKLILKDFLEKLSNLIENKPKINLADDSGWIVKSPKNSTLNISKINSLEIKTTSFEDALKELQILINL